MILDQTLRKMDVDNDGYLSSNELFDGRPKKCTGFTKRFFKHLDSQNEGKVAVNHYMDKTVDPLLYYIIFKDWAKDIEWWGNSFCL